MAIARLPPQPPPTSHGGLDGGLVGVYTQKKNLIKCPKSYLYASFTRDFYVECMYFEIGHPFTNSKPILYRLPSRVL